jgi:alpha-tubulin suppressor-like RCC1 family protein
VDVTVHLLGRLPDGTVHVQPLSIAVTPTLPAPIVSIEPSPRDNLFYVLLENNHLYTFNPSDTTFAQQQQQQPRLDALIAHAVPLPTDTLIQSMALADQQLMLVSVAGYTFTAAVRGSIPVVSPTNDLLSHFIVMVACGSGHSLFVSDHGHVYSVGANR